MARFSSLEDLAGKIEWEGGIAETVSYGIKASDMPAGYLELEELWSKLEVAQELVEDLEGDIHDILEPHDPA